MDKDTGKKSKPTKSYKSTADKKKTPTIGFISHMDTSPDASGKDIKARIIKNYDGKVYRNPAHPHPKRWHPSSR